MADGVDAAMQLVKPADGQLIVDCSAAEAELGELTTSNNPVLSTGERGELSPTWMTFSMTISEKVIHVCHGPHRGRFRRTGQGAYVTVGLRRRGSGGAGGAGGAGG